jgi:hypothetical protein
VIAAELRSADGSIHRPEVGVGEENVDCMQLGGMVKLAPVSGNHVRGCENAHRAAEFGHDLAPGEAVLRAARVLDVGQH